MGAYQLYVAAAKRTHRRSLDLSFVLVPEKYSPMARMPHQRKETCLVREGACVRCAWGPCDVARERVIIARLFLGQCDARNANAVQDFIKAPQHIEHVCEKVVEKQLKDWDDKEWVECVLQRLERTSLLQWAVKRPDFTRLGVVVSLAKFVDEVLAGEFPVDMVLYDGPPVCSCPSMART